MTLNDLRQRLTDLGMTGYVEQQQVLQEICWWLTDFKNEHRFHLKEITAEEAIDELLKAVKKNRRLP